MALKSPLDLLTKLQKESKFSDAVIHGNNGSGDFHFRVHRCILSLHSPVWNAMFSVDMKEASSRKIDLSDTFSLDCVKIAYNYMYSLGLKHDIGLSLLLEVWSFSHKYQITGLFDEIKSRLRLYMNERTFLDIFEASFYLDDREMMDSALGVIRRMSLPMKGICGELRRQIMLLGTNTIFPVLREFLSRGEVKQIFDIAVEHHEQNKKTVSFDRYLSLFDFGRMDKKSILACLGAEIMQDRHHVVLQSLLKSDYMQTCCPRQSERKTLSISYSIL